MEQRLSGSKLDPLGPTGTSWAAGAASTGRGNRGDRQKSAFPLFDTKEILPTYAHHVPVTTLDLENGSRGFASFACR